ncbi:MAG: zinc-dependent alcohol dehydrogenase [Anaerolineae bacterium]
MPQAYTLVAPHTLELRTYEEGPLGPRDVRLRSLLSGISHGTEMNLYRGSSPFADKHFDAEHRLFMPNESRQFYAHRLGYEMVSRVEEVGVEVHTVSVGDMVHTATPHQPTTTVNLDQDATAAIPMHVLPQGVSPDQAVFFALSGVALAAVHDAQIKVGDRVAISGLGTIGLLVVQLAKASGALHVAAFDPIAKRRDLALRLGADEVIDPSAESPAERLKFGSMPKGADVVIEASGNGAALHEALRCAHMGGTVVTLGYYQGGAASLRLGEEWHHNRLNLVSSMGVWNCPSRFYPMWSRPRVSDAVVELLRRGALRTDGLITHRFPYAQAPEAYRLLEEHPGETVKVVLEYP